MWRKEDGSPRTPDVSSGTSTPITASRPVTSGPSVSISGRASACVSQGIKIKGELTGSEDLFIDGTVDGKITLSSSTLTVGPNATVKAEISAKDVVIRGRAEGKFTATERVQIWHTARVNGDIKADRIAIEEGAELHGRMEAGKESGAAGNSQPGKKAESSKTDEKAPSGAASAAD
jgi:cytoskeletal protein CcmA (bactofilin family)